MTAPTTRGGYTPDRLGGLRRFAVAITVFRAEKSNVTLPVSRLGVPPSDVALPEATVT